MSIIQGRTPTQRLLYNILMLRKFLEQEQNFNDDDEKEKEEPFQKKSKNPGAVDHLSLLPNLLKNLARLSQMLSWILCWKGS